MSEAAPAPPQAPISDLRSRPVQAAEGLAPGFVSDWLAWAASKFVGDSDSPQADAEVLLAALLNVPRSNLPARAGDPLEAATVLRYASWIERRKQGEPVAYVIGRQGFWTLDLVVDTSVLIPRADTETLVEWALEILKQSTSKVPHILDLGTGSGAIALALAQSRPDASVTATDTSAEALELARLNAREHGIGNVRFVQGSWLDAVTKESPLPPGEGWVRDFQSGPSLAGIGESLTPGLAYRGVTNVTPRQSQTASPGGRGEISGFNLIVSNPPYIAEDDAHLAALRFEPRIALTSGADGLDAIREIIRDAPAHLSPDGWLLLEHGHDQAARVRALMAEAGFTDVQTRRDFGDIERVTGGRRADRAEA